MRARRATRDGATAVYARFLDGEHMWLAVRGADSLALELHDGRQLPVPSEPGTDAGTPVAVVCFDVAAALADDVSPALELALLSLTAKGAVPVAHAASRRKGPTVPAPTTLDGRWQFAVGQQRGNVVIKRKPVEPTVEATGFRATPDGATVQLATSESTARLVHEGTVVAELPIVDGECRIGRLPEVAPGVIAALVVGGLPVARRRSMLTGPQPAVMLPPLAGGLELRWFAGGRLGVQRREPTG